MKRLLILCLFSLMAVGSTPAPASTFTLDFGGLQNNEEVLNYYNGGFGSLGSGPGPGFGITFTPSFLATTAVPPYGPSRVGLLNGPSAIMDVSGGFHLLSFYYEAADNSGSVALWSGLDGTGVKLADISLTSSATWNAAGLNFGGTALAGSLQWARWHQVRPDHGRRSGDSGATDPAASWNRVYRPGGLVPEARAGVKAVGADGWR